MSTLNSSSTLEQIKAAFYDNASYAEDGSVAKAKAFVTACTLLLYEVPKQTGNGPAYATMNPDLIAKRMESAEKWIESHDTGASSTNTGGPRVTRASFQNFR